MVQQPRKRPSPAMGVAVVALVFSTTGVATGQLPNPLPLQNPATPQTVSRAAPEATEGLSDVYCRPGERAVGGGGTRTGFINQSGYIDGSFPILANEARPGANPTGWRVSARRPDGGPAMVQAWVVCEKP